MMSLASSLRSAATRIHPGVAIFWVCLFFPACVPGGVITRGGVSGEGGVQPSITLTRGADYEVVCFDQQEFQRRQSLSEQERQNLGPPVNYVAPEQYRGGCEVEGESSVFFLFNIWPATRPLDVEYAIAQPVQRLEGDTMIHIRTWHETHYYSILGRARVFKIRGDVIRYRETSR